MVRSDSEPSADRRGTKADSFTERRRDRRLELALPLEFSAPSSSAPFPRPGVSRNVSTGGIYFETEMEPTVKLNDPISLRIAVPQRQDTGNPPLTLHGDGHVVRIERSVHPARVSADADVPFWGVAVAFSTKPIVRMSSLIDYLMSGA